MNPKKLTLEVLLALAAMSGRPCAQWSFGAYAGLRVFP